MDVPTIPKNSNIKVLIGVVVIKIFDKSLNQVFGLLFASFFERIKSSAVEISLVINLTLVISNFTGIVAGFVMKYLSPKSVAMFGTMCVSCGLLLSSLASSFSEIVVTYSVLVGTGIGLVGPATFMCIIASFSNNRTQAVALSSIGSVIGDIILPQIVGFLLFHHKFSETILTIGFLSLLGTFGSFLLGQTSLRKQSLPKISEETNLILIPKTSSIFNRLDLHLLKDKNFLIRISGVACCIVVSTDFHLCFVYFLKVSFDDFSVLLLK
jgi:MFS family permease